MTSQFLLALDASSPRSAIALGPIDDPGAEILGDATEDGPQTSARLTERIALALSSSRLRVRDLAGIACGIGPGTFTGCRVALATAKGMAYGSGLSLRPISSLAALAASHLSDGLVLAVLDARRGEVYAQAFELAGGEILPRSEATVGLAADLAKWADDGALALGPGAHLLPDGFRAERIPGPSSIGLWRAARAAYSAQVGVDPDAVDVMYLRASYAELGVNRPKRTPYVSPYS
jgi:tRNA threonylcarbamoyl adenosine modification protein YeaZ